MEYPKISRENNFDVVRLFAALQVCTGHIFTHFDVSGGIFSKILSYFPGVTIFFAISGFLITASWCRSKSIKQYAKNRFLRIFPALFVCFIILQLALIVLGHYSLNSFKDPQVWMYWIGQLTLGQFFTPDALRNFGVGAPNGSLWTIPIEIEFYILLPIIFVFLLRINVKIKLLIIALISVVINIWLALSVIPDIHMTNAAELMNGDGMLHTVLITKLLGVTVLPYLYCFLIGSLLYIYWDKIKKFFINKAFWWLLAYLIFIVASGSNPSHLLNNIWNFTCNVFLACVAISSSFSFGKVYKFLYGWDISYGVYIIHMIVVNVMIECGYGYNWIHAIIALLVTILLALAMYKYVEKPSLQLKTISLRK